MSIKFNRDKALYGAQRLQHEAQRQKRNDAMTDRRLANNPAPEKRNELVRRTRTRT